MQFRSPNIAWRFPALGLIATVFMIASGCGTTSTPSQGTTPPAGGSASVASGVTLGYVWDQKASGLRPMLGMPGASYLGSPIYNDGTYQSGIACSRSPHAILTSKHGAIFLTSLPTGVPVQLANKLSAKQVVVLGPSCSTALVYAPDTSTMDLIQGLPSKPQVATISLSGNVTAAAVSDSGAVLAAVSRSNGTAVQFLPAGAASAASVVTVSRLGGLAFVANAESALIADAGKNVVYLAEFDAGGASTRQIASATDGIASPVGVGASADGRWAVIANQQGAVVRVDLTHQAPNITMQCRCTPTEVIPLNSKTIFRLTALGTGPMWVFDGDAPRARVAFIPGIPTTTVAGVAQ